jgi:putative ABC transport system permease protein
MLKQLDFIDLAWSLGLIAIAIAIISWQKLGLVHQLARATFQTIIQLFGIGYILYFVFADQHPWSVIITILIMISIVSMVTSDRISRKIPHLFFWIWSAILLTVILTLSYTIIIIIKPALWYDPQYLLPLSAIIIAQAMNSATLAGERLLNNINTHQKDIETHLSLGANSAQAIALYYQSALKIAIQPTINIMMIVGIVTLPANMTGQLLSGTPPLQAIAYQILILFLVTFTDIIIALLVITIITKKFFNSSVQLQLP